MVYKPLVDSFSLSLSPTPSGGASNEVTHDLSPDTGSEHVSATPPPAPPIERTFSSASKHYLSLSRLNSIFPVSRSSSGALSAPTSAVSLNKKSRVNAIQENISKTERVRCVCVNPYSPLVVKLK